MKPRMFLDKPFTMFYHDIFPVNRQGLASQHPAFVIFTVQIIHPLFENMENNGTIVLQRLCTKVLERPGRWAPGTAGSERWLCPCLSSSRSPEKCVSQHFSHIHWHFFWAEIDVCCLNFHQFLDKPRFFSCFWQWLCRPCIWDYLGGPECCPPAMARVGPPSCSCGLETPMN